jgi:hypothetical protein
VIILNKNKYFSLNYPKRYQTGTGAGTVLTDRKFVEKNEDFYRSLSGLQYGGVSRVH